ncbi:hypothetical protein [Jannaschia sp. 2305UL9-9]|uniref:hypothetical protein n=1 Tax=Jannaschia sp. 2305UL9-9 TaxID=3121638 RepID=UPI0035284C42
MTDHIRSAHIRAARVNPAYGTFDVFRQVADATTGRALAGQVQWVETCKGRIRWTDLDEFNRTLGGAAGVGQAALLVDWPTTPAALRDQDGVWYAVKSALGSDTLRVFTIYQIRRWTGDAPVVAPVI